MSKSKTIYSPEYIELIDILASERKRLDLSQAEVAEQLRLRQTDISKIENKERRLDVLELKKLLKIYRVSKNSKLRIAIENFFIKDNEHEYSS